MNILISGSGRSGSWQIRGVQLGAAIGASVEPCAVNVDGYNRGILVKRPPADLIQRLQRRRVPIVWDVVDAWPQPVGNDWGADQCLQWLADRIKVIRPAGIVAATQAMAGDCKAFSIPVLALAHHARPGIERNPVREQVRNVGYEGGGQYLGWWREALEAECASRGWTFHVNPQSLADMDIVVAVRDQTGYACRKWKSNVKLANAQGSGTPCVVNREAGYLETACDAELWADDMDEMRRAMDELTPREARLSAAQRLFESAPTIESTAATYLAWLQDAKF